MSEQNKDFLNFFFWLVVKIALLIIVVERAYADDGIYCSFCKKQIYTYKGDIVKDAILKTPLDKGKFIKKDKKANELIENVDVNMLLVCPHDNAPLNGYLYWAWSRKYELPKLIYPAFTFLTKDKDKNFVWIPEEVTLEN